MDNYDSSSSDSEQIQLPDDEPILEPAIPPPPPQPMMPQSVFYPNMMIATMQPQQPMRKVRRHDDDYTFDGSLPKEFHQTHQNISNVWK